MNGVFRKPHPRLSPWVSELWYFQGVDPAAVRERLVPSGRMQLLINLDDDRLSYWTGGNFEHLHRLPGTMVSGLFERAIAIDVREQRAIAGVVLEPLTAHQWFGLSASGLCNQAAPLDAFWPRHSLRERLLEARTKAGVLPALERALLERVRYMEPVSSPLYSAIEALELGQPVAAVQAALGMSPRRLRTAFERELGLSPKRFSRIRRLQRALLMLDRPDAPCGSWARLAAGAGYADQAHFIREFKQLVGLTPGSYRSRNPCDRNHIPLLSKNTPS